MKIGGKYGRSAKALALSAVVIGFGAVQANAAAPVIDCRPNSHTIPPHINRNTSDVNAGLYISCNWDERVETSIKIIRLDTWVRTESAHNPRWYKRGRTYTTKGKYVPVTGFGSDLNPNQVTRQFNIRRKCVHARNHYWQTVTKYVMRFIWRNSPIGTQTVYVPVMQEVSGITLLKCR